MQGYSKKSRVFQNSPLQPKIIDTVKIMVTVKIHGTVKILERWKLIINKIKKKTICLVHDKFRPLEKKFVKSNQLELCGTGWWQKVPKE